MNIKDYITEEVGYRCIERELDGVAYLDHRGDTLLVKCPFCGATIIETDMMVKDYSLRNKLWTLKEENDSLCGCDESYGHYFSYVVPAIWKAWKYIADCPPNITPRRFLVQQAKGSLSFDSMPLVCPPDRDTKNWLDEVDEIYQAYQFDTIEEAAEHSLEYHDTKLYFHGYEFDIYYDDGWHISKVIKAYNHKEIHSKRIRVMSKFIEKALNKLFKGG